MPSRPFSKSTSVHLRPCASPCLKPRVTATAYLAYIECQPMCPRAASFAEAEWLDLPVRYWRRIDQRGRTGRGQPSPQRDFQSVSEQRVAASNAVG